MFKVTLALVLGLGFVYQTQASDFVGMGANMGGGASLFPTMNMPDLILSPYGAPTMTPTSSPSSGGGSSSGGTSTTSVPGATPGSTAPTKQCNIGGAVLVINPAPNSPVTVQATVSNIGNVTAPSGGC